MFLVSLQAMQHFLKCAPLLGAFLELFDSNLVQKHEAGETSSKKKCKRRTLFQEVLFCIVSLQVMAPSSRLRRLSVKSRFVVVACLVAGHGSKSRLRRLAVKSSFVAVAGLVAGLAEVLEMWSTLGRFLELFYSNLVQKHEAEETISKKM